MAKLVLLSASMTGRTHELKVDKTTIGRVEDNTFPIPEPSVSSHHCEILLRGNDVVVRDLNSTNGTFINNEKVTERVLKHNEVLRLGQIEMRLEVEGGAPPPPVSAASTASSAPASSAAPTSGSASKKTVDHTIVMQRGVKLDELDQAARVGFDTKGTGFSRKEDKANRIFLIFGAIVGVVILGLLFYVYTIARK